MAGEGDGKRGASVKAKSKGSARRSDVQEQVKEGTQANKLTFPFLQLQQCPDEGPSKSLRDDPVCGQGQELPCLLPFAFTHRNEVCGARPLSWLDT